MKRYYFNVLWMLSLFMVMMHSAAFAADPVFRAGFDQNSFAQTGWTVFPVGSGEYSPAPVIVSAIPSSFDDPTHTNGRGILVSAQNGQGALVLGPVVPTNGELAVLSVSILVTSPEAIVAVGALDVAPDGTIANVDGSATYSFESNSSAFVKGYHRVRVLYQPKNSAFIPLFQIAVDPSKQGEFVTAMVDNFEVHLLNQQVVTDPGLQQLFGLVKTTPANTPTPTRTPTVTPTPTRTPTATPQQQPVTKLADYTLSNTSDNLESYSPAVAHDTGDEFAVVAVDQRSGFNDISLWNLGTEPKESRGAFTVNETFEDTSASNPDIAVNGQRVRHIVWTDDRSTEKLNSIYLAQYNTNGARIGSNDFEVNRLFVDTNTKTPAVDAPLDNEILVTWVDDRNFVDDVFVRRLRWQNNSVDPLNEEDFQINIPFDNTVAGTPDIAADPNGNVIAVWMDNRLILGDQKRNDIYARAFRLDTPIQEDGTLPASAPEIQISLFDNNTDDCFDPRIAYENGSGLFVIVWENYVPDQNVGRVQAAVLGASGNIIQEEFTVSNSSAGEFVRYPDVSAIGNGRFLISWQKEELSVVYGRVYDAANHRFLTGIVELTPAPNANINTGFGTWQRIAGGSNNAFLSVFDYLRVISGTDYADVSAYAGRLNNLETVGTIPAKTLSGKTNGGTISGVTVKSESSRQREEQKEIREETGYSFRR